MDKKTEEMIALGASYALNCKPCMEIHKRLAAEAGVTSEEMQEALGVAEAVKEGAGKKNKEFAEKMFGPIKAAQCCPVGSACCS